MVPWRDFGAAACGVLEFLHHHLGWDVWTVTRVIDDRQVVLHAYPATALPPGASLPWEESFCRLMVAGEAPRAATVTAAVPEYAARSMGPVDRVAAYLGVPLVTADGDLFGTVCAVGFRARPRSANRDLPLVEMVARMLSTLMAAGLTPDDPPPGPDLRPTDN
ncbi:GAF domain-containing protein [Geodermatophilus sabuli]|uniref:GAF domain-containing protein n=1 Tax=Geodermatophilus sabuli TaxID=1564158 RepID=A0A285EJS9_9ACTN|nr:GAF domain-containing protein [Geodermatophilus sabuli]MBB3086950.1 GAF domain-containing protein [Geodermatophilus sabuli]SNX99270.1 GAF domain-containing protein [Geodermatophilus sabuli]